MSNNTSLSQASLSESETTSIQIKKVLESRYPKHIRPSSWDARREGKDVVLTKDGRTITLWSDGQQSPPQPGWEIVLREFDAGLGYTWTLYGMKNASHGE